MNSLLFPATMYSELSREFSRCDTESCAIAFANPVTRQGNTRLLIRTIHYPPATAYSRRSRISAQLNPTYVARMAKLARGEKAAMVFIHSHVGGVEAKFSKTDDNGELKLKSFLDLRNPNNHLAVVIGGSACRGRLLATHISADVYEVGRNIRRVSTNAADIHHIPQHFDRQVRAFGIDGQARLHQMRVGIVGLGGTGSLVAQQLAYLGVESFLLIDPDTVETTNLNRIVCATDKDVGRPKVEVAARGILSVRANASIETCRGNVTFLDIARKLVSLDTIFSCTDSHGSRAILNRIAYQYYVPCVDMGISVAAKGGRVSHITGRIQMLAPGLSCLTCGSLLDPDAIRRDFMDEEELAHDQYFVGQGVPQPAVVSLNSTVSSLATTMWLSATVGIPSEPRLLIYDGVKGRLRAATQSPTTNCVDCSAHGCLGRGDAEALPARLK